MWPGLVGKGPDSEPPIDLDTMLDLTQAAEVDGAKFDGVDLFLSLPHTDIDSSDDDLQRLEVILKLTRELGVNLAGVEIILNMREKMEAMQRQMTEFVNTLNNEFIFRGKPAEPAGQNSLIPVLSLCKSEMRTCIGCGH